MEEELFKPIRKQIADCHDTVKNFEHTFKQSLTQDYHALASLKLDHLQSFKRLADQWFDQGNLNSKDQNARIFRGDKEDYMEGDKLISRELLQEHLNLLMLACTGTKSVLVANMQGSWKEELTTAMQKPFSEIDELEMHQLKTPHTMKNDHEKLEE